MPPSVAVYGFPHGGPDDPAAQQQSNLLPITGDFVELAGSPPVVATTAVPGYQRLSEFVYGRLGFPAAEFRGLRMVLPYPPMSTKVVAKWDLPQAPTT